MPAKYTSMHLG